MLSNGSKSNTSTALLLYVLVLADTRALVSCLKTMWVSGGMAVSRNEQRGLSLLTQILVSQPSIAINVTQLV